MKKVIFLDLDGTLWMNGKIPKSAIEAIHRAQDNGHKVILNTGRSRCEVNQSVLNLQLDGYCFSAGSDIEIDKIHLEDHPMDIDDIKSVQAVLEKNHYHYSLEGKENTFVNFKWLLFGNRIGHHFKSISEMKESDYSQIMKISIHSLRDIHISKFINELPTTITFTRFGKHGGEFTDKRYNKATAMSVIMEYYHHEYSSIAFGDSENDIPMFEASDISVAMGNAQISVQSFVDHVTTHIKDKGLYNAFCRLQLI